MTFMSPLLAMQKPLRRKKKSTKLAKEKQEEDVARAQGEDKKKKKKKNLSAKVISELEQHPILCGFNSNQPKLNSM